MKICYIDEDGRFGGPQQRMLLVAKALTNKKNVKIKFFLPKNDTKDFQQKLLKYKFDFQTLRLTRLSLEFNIILKYIFFFLYEIIILCLSIKKEKFDIIQINSTSQFKGVISALIVGKPSIWVIEDTNFNFIIKNIFLLLAKISKSKIIYTSKSVDKYYSITKQFKKKDSIEIFAPVDLNEFNNKVKFRKYNYFNDKIVITSISGVIPIKGALEFVYLAKEILKEFPDVCFIFTGQIISSQKRYAKKFLNEIKKLPKNKFFYKGLCNNVPEILYNSDLFVCTSKSEAGPITLLEAIAMDLPIITSNVGIVPQIIKNKKSGIILKKNNLENLVKETKKLLLDRSLFLKLSQHQNLVKKKFSHINVANQYFNFYKKINFQSNNVQVKNLFKGKYIQFIRNLLALLCIGFVFYFILKEEKFLSLLYNLQINYLTISIAVSIFTISIYCKFFHLILTKITSLKIKFNQFKFIYFNSQLYNFVPFLGLVYRAIRLKNYGLSYSNYLFSYLFISWKFFISFSLFFLTELIFFYFFFKNIIFLIIFYVNLLLLFFVNISLILISIILKKFKIKNIIFHYILKFTKFLKKNLSIPMFVNFIKFSLLIHLFEFITFFFVSKSLGINLHLYEVIVFFIIITIVDFFPVTPQNIGFSELSLAYVMHLFGFSYTEGALIRLFVRFSNIVATILLLPL